MDPDSDPLGRADGYPRHKPSASGERTIRGAYSVDCVPCNAGYTKCRSLGRGTAEQLCHYVENLPSPENIKFRPPSDALVYLLHREEAGSFAGVLAAIRGLGCIRAFLANKVAYLVLGPRGVEWQALPHMEWQPGSQVDPGA
ncbi:hypothetical protein OIDMADRAFT_180939 [Oidiodendron maius Zn]|uniref:Uncharacterized protein n=1 Tax=Oidiodendron maius (strain Zn) TaxID=913774 RepID=A0A0C3DC14_OIDMZ|nr:hypothetical protein OIDMADRAFT_180939 [Oidiodendron maius Zn]